jgi:hypothetical protein
MDSPQQHADLVQILLTTLVGSGVGTALVGAFFKHKFDAQLEVQKSLLVRAAKVYDRQLSSLCEIHFRLELILHYLQRATFPGRYKNEAPEGVQLQRMAEHLGAASDEFSKNKLLFSDALITKLDSFFKGTFNAAMLTEFTADPMVQGDARAKYITDARTAAGTELPLALAAIREEAKKVIHGDLPK